MKKILLFILLFFAGITQAQYQTDLMRVINGQTQYFNGITWVAIPTSLTGGGFTLGTNKVYPTTAGDKFYIRTNADDTTGTDLANIAGKINATQLNSIVLQSAHQVYFMGNSLTYNGDYPTKVGTLLGNKWAVINKGVSGNTTAQMLTRFATDVTDNLGCEYVVILGGINSVRADISAASIESDLQTMYSAAKAANIKVVAVKITPFKNHTDWTSGRQIVLDAVNTWMNTATDVDYVIDAYDALEEADTDALAAAYDSGDHLHLTNAGYLLLGTTVYNAVTWTARFDHSSGASLTIADGEDIYLENGLPTVINNQTSLLTTIANNTSKIYPYDNGVVTLRAIVDDAGTETDKQILTNDGWFGIPAAYLFDGVDDYVSVADNDLLEFGLDDFTIERFIKITDYTPAAEKVLLEKHASNLGWKLLLTTDGKLKLQFGNGTNFTTYSYLSAALGVVDGTKCFIAVTADRSGNVIFYVNGIVNNTVDISGSVAQTISSTGALNTFGNGTTYLSGADFGGRFYNKVLTVTAINQHYNNGRPDLYEVEYTDRNASSTNLHTSFTNSDFATHTPDGTGFNAVANAAGQNNYNAVLNIKAGATYRVYYNLTLNSGTMPNFVIATNSNLAGGILSSVVAVAGGVTIEFTPLTPGSWKIGFLSNDACDITVANSVTEVYTGCITEFLPRNAGRLGWIESSGNQLSGNTFGSPICLDTENKPQQYRDIKKGIDSTVTTLTSIVPKGYIIREIRVKGSTDETGINIGTTSGGAQIVSAGVASATASLLTLAATANAGYSETADQTLYVDFTNAAGTIDLIFKMEKVGN